MKPLRTYGCRILLVSLLGLLGCGGGVGYVKKGAEIKASTVTIKDCNAIPDTAQVDVNDTL